MGKKFAIFFCILVFFITMGSLGMFFVMMRLSMESGGFLTRQAFMAQTYRQASIVNRDDWDITRAEFLAQAAQAQKGSNLHHIGRYTPVFYNIWDPYPKDILQLHIVQVLDQLDSWKLIRTINGEKWINLDWMPKEVLLDVPGLNQQTLGLPTGCEIVALAMLINKYAEVDVFTLIEEMPFSYDPLLGFRGDPFTRGGFTILPPALLELTERHIGQAVDMTGASIEDVQAQLAIGRPVLTWLRGMFGFYVHVIVLTGYNPYGFFYNDPWLGGVNEFITYEAFLAMWEDPIRDLRLNRVYPPRIALSY